jgi:hypothetical protein
MLFGGSPAPDRENDVLGATSADGIHWSCTGTVLLRPEDIPGSDGIHTIQGATLAGEPVLLVESLIDGGSEIWLAKVSVERQQDPCRRTLTRQSMRSDMTAPVTIRPEDVHEARPLPGVMSCTRYGHDRHRLVARRGSRDPLAGDARPAP